MSRLNLILLVLLGAQLALLVGGNFLGGDTYRPRVTVEGDQLFPTAQPEAVSDLILEREGGTTHLRKTATGWVVASEGDKKADAQMIDTALQSLANLKPGNVVSENPLKHEDFQVTGAQAVEVTAKNASGGIVAHFVLGKTTPDWRGVYLRYPVEGNDVMLVTSNIRSTFDRGEGKPGAWRAKEILQGNMADVRTLEIVKPDETVVIERQLTVSTEEGKAGEQVATEEDDWKVVQPVEGMMSRYAGNNLARTVTDLRADGFAAEAKSLAEMGLDPPAARVTARMAEGAELVFEIGAEEGSKRFVRTPDAEDVYLVPAYRLFDFLKQGEELLEQKPAPPATEPAAESPAAEQEGDGTADDGSGDGGATEEDDEDGDG